MSNFKDFVCVLYKLKQAHILQESLLKDVSFKNNFPPFVRFPRGHFVTWYNYSNVQCFSGVDTFYNIKLFTFFSPFPLSHFQNGKYLWI